MVGLQTARFAPLLALAVALTVAFGATNGGKAQTTSGTGLTPTLIPSPGSMPDAADLFSKMKAAMSRRRSAHLEIVLTATIAGGPDAGTAVASEIQDILQRDKRARLVSSIHDTVRAGTPVAGTPETDETVDVRTRSAFRRGSLGWDCSTDSHLSYELVGPLSPGARITTIGATTIGSTAVWQIRATFENAQTGGTGTVDYFINRKSNLLAQVVSNVASPIPGSSPPSSADVAVTGNYSRYGEKVRIVLPKRCRKGGVDRRATYLLSEVPWLP